MTELTEAAEGALQWLEQLADRFELEWPNTSKHCRIHVGTLRAAIQGNHPTPQDLLNKAEAERDRAREELARVREMGDALAGAIRGLPVEEWVEQERDGSPTLIGYVMQAQGEWDAASQALAAWNAR